MNPEFTGERVIPGQVDDDLWNEHFARYAFARRFAENRRVLDAGCGTGYGAAELASVAHNVTGIDISAEALGFAAKNYPSVRFLQGSCKELPFAAGSFDLIVMFEVIEHIAEWQRVLEEAKRVLTPEGRLVVSTPNKSFYARTRKESGPNPYHEHEFEYAEFRDALTATFSHVAMVLEDHTEGILFRTADQSGACDARMQEGTSAPEQSSFFIGVCSDSVQPEFPAFVYVPRSSNLLHEKLQHIERLEGEVRIKDGWIAELQLAHQTLLQQHAAQLAELEKSNRWATQMSEELTAARKRIDVLGHDVETLTAVVEERTKWAQDTELRLTADLESCIADRDQQTQSLGACVEALHQTEAALEERTRWARDLNEQKARLDAAINAARASRWVRLGRAIGLGPELQEL